MTLAEAAQRATAPTASTATISAVIQLRILSSYRFVSA